MKRSSPQTKEQKKEAVVVDLQELEDKKYFLFQFTKKTFFPNKKNGPSL